MTRFQMLLASLLYRKTRPLTTELLHWIRRWSQVSDDWETVIRSLPTRISTDKQGMRCSSHQQLELMSSHPVLTYNLHLHKVNLREGRTSGEVRNSRRSFHGVL